MKVQKLIILLLFVFALPIATFAQTTPIYICGANSVTLTPTIPSGYTLANGDKVIWKVDNIQQPAKTYTNDLTAIKLTTDPALLDGDHTYTVIIQPADVNACPSEESNPYTITKLPSITAGVSSDIASYCNENGTAFSTITATEAPTTLPSGVTYEYSWTAVDASSNPVTITDIGTSTDNIFKMKPTAIAGTYTFTSEIKYKIASGTLYPADACVASSTTSVTVTDKPGKPSITIE